ncbi:MAG: hypothetical protein LBQ27_02155 [Clostridiales bacterium]|jgi:hypothetical protein|nr:hypothetical protein [Clostridiales bacterium]
MSKTKIAVLTEMRGYRFEVEDFESIFSEMSKEGDIECARFYNYDSGNFKIDRFIIKQDSEILPKAIFSNSADSRVIIDCAALAEQNAGIIVLVNVKDDEVLIKYLRSCGVKIYAVKCGAADKEAYKLYDKVYVLNDVRALKRNSVDEDIINKFKRLLAYTD